MAEEHNHLHLTYRIDPKVESTRRQSLGRAINMIEVIRQRLNGLLFDTPDKKVADSIKDLEEVSLSLARLKRTM